MTYLQEVTYRHYLNYLLVKKHLPIHRLVSFLQCHLSLHNLPIQIQIMNVLENLLGTTILCLVNQTRYVKSYTCLFIIILFLLFAVQFGRLQLL